MSFLTRGWKWFWKQPEPSNWLVASKTTMGSIHYSSRHNSEKKARKAAAGMNRYEARTRPPNSSTHEEWFVVHDLKGDILTFDERQRKINPEIFKRLHPDTVRVEVNE